MRDMRNLRKLRCVCGHRARAVDSARPKLSLLTRGKLDDISQAKLEECLRALGHDIEIGISRRHEGAGKIVVREVDIRISDIRGHYTYIELATMKIMRMSLDISIVSPDT